MESRRHARDDAVRQKEHMAKKFEYMQTKGTLDAKTLTQFGITEEKFNEMMNSPREGTTSNANLGTPGQSQRARRNSMHEKEKDTIPNIQPYHAEYSATKVNMTSGVSQS